MSELTAVKNALDQIEAIDHVRNVALISRGGMFVMGTTPEEGHRETFAAMCAIVLGAGQTVTTELRDRLNEVKVMMGEKDLVLVSLGPRYLIAGTADRQVDDVAVVQEARSLADMIERML